MDSVGPARRRERHGAVRRSGVHRMLDLFEEAAGGELRQLGLAVGLHDLGDRNTVAPHGLDNVVATAPLTPDIEVVGDEIVVPAPADGGRQRRVGRPVWPTERVTQSRPLLVSGYGHGNPAVAPTELVDLVGAVQVLWRRRWPAVTVALQQRAVCRVPDHLPGG